jgi:galactonate dehydratase
MKIIGICPFAVNNGPRNFMFVKVMTDEGIYGLGESGLTGREQAVAGAVEHFGALLVGEDPTRIEYLWQKMWRGSFWRGGSALSAAIAAIDIALWDINGKALGVPVYRLLGGRNRDKVRCYCHLAGSTPEEYVAEARKYVAEGYEVVRFSVQGDSRGVLEPAVAVRRTIESFEAIREAVGDDVEIALDIHTRLDPTYAIQLGRALEPYRPYFLEDPIRSENPQSFAQLRQHISSPIATGEQRMSKWEFRELIEQDLIDYARIDVCLAGGITESKKIAGWCETHYINLALHNPLGPVSAAACLHLDIACPNFGVQELPRKPGFMAEVFPQQVPYAQGHLLVPETPGLGVDIDEVEAAKRPFVMREMQHYRREDGSVTEW